MDFSFNKRYSEGVEEFGGSVIGDASYSLLLVIDDFRIIVFKYIRSKYIVLNMRAFA